MSVGAGALGLVSDLVTGSGGPTPVENAMANADLTIAGGRDTGMSVLTVWALESGALNPYDTEPSPVLVETYRVHFVPNGLGGWAIGDPDAIAERDLQAIQSRLERAMDIQAFDAAYDDVDNFRPDGDA